MIFWQYQINAFSSSEISACSYPVSFHIKSHTGKLLLVLLMVREMQMPLCNNHYTMSLAPSVKKEEMMQRSSSYKRYNITSKGAFFKTVGALLLLLTHGAYRQPFTHNESSAGILDS